MAAYGIQIQSDTVEGVLRQVNSLAKRLGGETLDLGAAEWQPIPKGMKFSEWIDTVNEALAEQGVRIVPERIKGAAAVAELTPPEPGVSEEAPKRRGRKSNAQKAAEAAAAEKLAAAPNPGRIKHEKTIQQEALAAKRKAEEDFEEESEDDPLAGLGLEEEEGDDPLAGLGLEEEEESEGDESEPELLPILTEKQIVAVKDKECLNRALAYLLEVHKSGPRGEKLVEALKTKWKVKAWREVEPEKHRTLLTQAVWLAEKARG